MKYELSVVIPSRNEEFLGETIADILEHKEAPTEVIAILDGQWAVKPIPMHPDVTIIYHPKAVGQRGGTNDGVKVSQAKYIMKVDAHCSFDQGFDRKMLEAFKETGDNVTMVPIMKNLWAFSWKCKKCGMKVYQDKPHLECPNCGGRDTMYKKMIWKAKKSPNSTSFLFDPTPHFNYFGEFKKRPEGQGDITETLSLQGSCFMCTKEKYQELNLCDEEFGSWGSQGIEISMKTRLSGGRVLCNHKTWYAHMFRTKPEFTFPWKNPHDKVKKAKAHARDLFFNAEWPLQIYPLSKIIEQFWPIPHWEDKDLKALKEQELKTTRSGIYSIKSLSNGRIYIGSAINISERVYEHLKRFREGKHCNVHLQNTYDKYGEKDLEFGILYFCKPEELIEKEQEFIDKYRDEVGWDNMFNICPTAGSTLGVACSEETKRKISIAQTGKEAWNKGLTKETDERVKEYSNKLKGQHTWEDKEHPRGMLGKHHTEETKHIISEKEKVAKEGAPRNEIGQFIKEDLAELKNLETPR